jgi:hypothetical protein
VVQGTDARDVGPGPAGKDGPDGKDGPPGRVLEAELFGR